MPELNYTLLRKFNAIAAKMGHQVCTEEGRHVRYVGGPRVDGRVVVEDGENYLQVHHDNLRMSPLAWVNEVPIYTYQALPVYQGFEMVNPIRQPDPERKDPAVGKLPKPRNEYVDLQVLHRHVEALTRELCEIDRAVDRLRTTLDSVTKVLSAVA